MSGPRPGTRLIAALLFLILLCVVDTLLAHVCGSLSDRQLAGFRTHAWISSGHNYLFSVVAAYALMFGMAGAVIAWRATNAIYAFLLALAFGLAHPLIMLWYHPFQPFYAAAHSQWWVEPLGWANWYMPAVSAVTGMLIWQGVSLLKYQYFAMQNIRQRRREC